MGRSISKISKALQTGQRERNLNAHSQRVHGWQLYPVKSLVHIGGITERTLYVLCAHDLFARLWESDKDRFDDIFGCKESNLEFWRRTIQLQDPWWAAHPHRGKVEAMSPEALAQTSPFRIFGDDTGLRKTRSVGILQWYTTGCKFGAKRSRLPFYIMPSHQLSPDVTEPTLQKVAVWSFEALQRGEHP